MKQLSKLLAVLFVLLGFHQLNAQDKKQKSEKKDLGLKQYPTGYAVLNAGLAYAIGDFADPNIGGASSGTTYQLSIAVPFVKSHLGLVGKINYSTYGMTNQPLFAQQSALSEKFGLDSNLTFTENTGQIIKQLNFLAGPYATFPIGDFSIDLRAMCGPTRFYRPALSVDLMDSNNTYLKTATQNANATLSFAYDFGISFRYNLLKSKKLCVLLSFDYGMTKQNFRVYSKSMYEDEIGMLKEGGHIEHIVDPISYFDVTGGIGYIW